MSKSKTDLFLLAIKCSPFPAIVFEKESESIYTNTPFDTHLGDIDTNQIGNLLRQAAALKHPSIFPFEANGLSYFFVSIVVYQSEAQEVLSMFLPNLKKFKLLHLF
ncbi:MAG: hypothetical protein Fur0010_23060 [Bdellovibrio sp.]